MSFDELTENEKIVFDTFVELMKKIGRIDMFTFFEKKVGPCGVCVYKENGKWITYDYERNEINGYVEYDNIYQLCIYIFKSLDKKSTDYCMKVFPELVQENLSKGNSHRTR